MNQVELQKLADYLEISNEELSWKLNQASPSVSSDDIADLKRIFHNSPRGSEQERLAFNKMNKLGYEELEKAKTFEQAAAILKKIPKTGELNREVLRKMLKLANNIRQTREVFEKSSGKIHHQANEKMTKLCKIALTGTSSYEQAKKVFKRTLPGSEMQNMALEKMLEFTQNAKQAKEVFLKSSSDSEIEQLAFQKLLEYTTDIDEIRTLYCSVAKNSTLYMMAIERLSEVAENFVSKSKNIDKIRYIYDILPQKSRVKKIALEKMLELIS